MDAWNYNRCGRHHFFEFTKEGNKQAQFCFERAIKLDSSYAQPYSWLAYNIALGMVYFDLEPSDRTLTYALEQAKKGLELDDGDAWSHMSVARVYLAKTNYDECEKACRTAINKNSSLAHAHCLLGDVLTCMNKLDSALLSLKEAIEISPEDPWRWAFYAYASMASLFNKNYIDAKEYAEEAVKVPGCQFWAFAHRVVAMAYLELEEDKIQTAVKELRKENADFSIKFAESHLFYLKDPRQVTLYLDGLRKAGLSE